MSIFIDASIEGDNVDQDEYIKPNAHRGDPERVMSRSELLQIGDCAYRWRLGSDEEEITTKALDWGSLADLMILQYEFVSKKVMVTPATYFNEKDEKEKPWNNNATACKEWNAKAKASGKLVVTQSMWERAEKAANMLQGDERLSEFVSMSTKQVLVTADFPYKDIKIPVKCLIDLVPDKNHPVLKNTLGDLKSTRGAAPFSYSRSCYTYGYHLQAAMCLDLYNAATGESRSQFHHVILESAEPNMPARRFFSEEFLSLGRCAYVAALERYGNCLKENQWASYEDQENGCVNGWAPINPELWMIQSGDVPEGGNPMPTRPDWMDDRSGDMKTTIDVQERKGE